MSKNQLIEAIQQRNETASTDFLMAFNENALKDYLHHLRFKALPRTDDHVWARSRRMRIRPLDPIAA